MLEKFFIYFFRPANISHLSFVNRIDADRKEAKEMTEKELEKIYNEAYRAVYWTAMQILKNEADAEDVVQDTFVSFMESYSNLEDTSKAVALLKKIAANKSLDRIKLSRTDDADDELLESVEAVPEDFLPDSIIESEDARRIVMDIINNALSDDIRRTLILFYFDEMSTKEIAEALGVPEGTVRRRLNFARNKIKKEVEKYEKENNTKLFGMAALPFLSKLFMKEAEQVPFKAMSASLTTLSASAEASTQGAGIKVAASAAKKGTGMMINKFVIGGIASAVAVGTTVGVILMVVNKPKEKPGNPAVTTTAVSETEESTKKTAGSMGRDYYENGGYAGQQHFYIIQDMTPEEIVELYAYYQNCAYEYSPDNYQGFKDKLKAEPNSFELDTDCDGVYTGYDIITTPDKIDHVENMMFFCREKNSLRMSMAICDLDKVKSIMEAYKNYYCKNGAECKEWDGGGTQDGGYIITVSDKEKYVVEYKMYRSRPYQWYRVTFTRLVK